jgi:hypothetical protein
MCFQLSLDRKEEKMISVIVVGAGTAWPMRYFFPCVPAERKEASNCKFILEERQLTLPLGLWHQLGSAVGSRRKQF